MAEITTCIRHDCDKAVATANECRVHHLETTYERYLDNTDLANPNKGIFAFARERMPRFAYQKTPKHHILMAQLILALYDPRLKNLYERLLQIIAFRGGAKSTLGNSIVIAYLIAFNNQVFKMRDTDSNIVKCRIEEKFIGVISETEDGAENFVDGVRSHFANDSMMRYYFPFQIRSVQERRTKQWAKAAFWINGMFVLGRGYKQQIRGYLKDASRFTFLIVDDLYSEENIKTEHSRNQVRKKFNNAILKALDPLLGKVAFLCTIIHEDTVAVDIQKNKLWKTVEVPIMPHEKFEELIALLPRDPVTNQVQLPYEDEPNQILQTQKRQDYFKNLQSKKDWGLAWQERYDLYFMALAYYEAIQNNETAGLYQELFHVIVPDTDKRFTQDMFQQVKVFRIFFAYGYMWVQCEELYGEIPQIMNVNFGIDLADAKKVDSKDDTVLTAVGRLLDDRLFVFLLLAGQFRLRDMLKSEYDGPELMRRDKVLLDRTAITQLGIADETFRQALIYHPTAVKVGVGGDEGNYCEEIDRLFKANRDYQTQIIKRVQASVEGKKWERIMKTLLPYYEPRMVFHCGDLKLYERQLEFLRRGAKDDQADGVECAVWNIQRPPTLKWTDVSEGLPIKRTESKQNIREIKDWRVFL
jgi:hypothetical protein